MNTKEKKEEREKGTVVSLIKLSFLKKGLAIGILLVMLVIAIGSASAANCGDTVTSDYTFTADLDCSGTTGHGLIVGADGITIDGDGYAIIGNTSCTSCRAGIYNYNSTQGYGHDDVTIKNLEIKDFCRGIYVYGSSGDSLPENNVIDNCTVHDNGNVDLFGHGIDLYCANNSKITNCTIYDNSGKVEGSCDDGGMGIRLYGCECGTSGKGYHTVTNNTIYGNRLSGIFSKMGVKHCNVSYNRIYENGEYIDANDHYMSGGMRLECIATNNWTIEHNNITNNTGPGIYVRGDYNNISHNNVVGNKNASGTCDVWGTDVDAGEGIYLGGDHNNLTANRFCYNEYKDIYNHTSGTVGNHGDDNTCDWTSNYNDAGTTGCTYRCMLAYKKQVTAKPPTTNNVPNNEFSTAQYGYIETDNGVYQTDTSETNYYAAHRFNFSVIWDASDIGTINVTWNGKGSHQSGSGHGATLYIWNGTGYEQLDSNSVSTDATLTGEVTSSISSYINSGNVTVLVEQNTKISGLRSRIETDYIRLKLVVTP